MVSIDLYRNETTRHADLILPTSFGFERDHYDVVFHALAVRNAARFTPPVFDKPEGAMHDWEIFREIAVRTAARLTKKKPLRKALAERVSLSLSPTVLVTALLALGRRTSMRALRADPAGIDLGPLRPTMPGRLQTRDQLIHLAPDVVIADLPRLREDPPGTRGRRAPADERTAPAGQQLLDAQHRAAHPLQAARHQLLMHPDDLAARGLSRRCARADLLTGRQGDHGGARPPST